MFYERILLFALISAATLFFFGQSVAQAAAQTDNTQTGAKTEEPEKVLCDMHCGEKVFVTSGITRKIQAKGYPKGVYSATLWDPKTGIEEPLFPPDKLKGSPKRSSKGELAVRGVEKEYTCIFIVDSLGVVRKISTPTDPALILSELYWSPSGDKLVFMRYIGTNEMGQIVGCKVYILDVASGKEELIAEQANDLCWASFDGNIYIRGNEKSYDAVMKYDPVKKTLANLESADFSGYSLSSFFILSLHSSIPSSTHS